MFSSFTMGPNGAMHGGPPPTRSECGSLWDRYMLACCEEDFPYSPTLPAGREVHIWVGRQLELLLAPGDAEWVRAHVVSMSQRNSGPFSPGTRWTLSVMLSEAAATGRAAEVLGADQLGMAELDVVRANVDHGGVLGVSTAASRSAATQHGGCSFRWLSPPTPPMPVDHDPEAKAWSWPWVQSGTGSAAAPWTVPEKPSVADEAPSLIGLTDSPEQYALMDEAAIESARALAEAEFVPIFAQAKRGQTGAYETWLSARCRRLVELAADPVIDELVSNRVPNPLEDAIAVMPIAALLNDGCMHTLVRSATPTLCEALVAVLPKRRAEVHAYAATVQKEEKLDRHVGKTMVIHGLVGRPELNGKRGRAVRFEAGRGRFVVDVEKERVLLKPANLQRDEDDDDETGVDSDLDAYADILLGVRVSFFLHRAAELYEQDSALTTALLFYRRNLGWAEALVERGDNPCRAANDIGNLALCLKRLGHLDEALKMYDRALEHAGPDQKPNVTRNRARCVQEMAAWSCTAGEYADVLAK